MRKGYTRKFGELLGGTLVSRVAGLLREVVVGGLFGASRATDLFAIALTVPTLFRRVLGEDMVEKGFLPPFRQLINAGDDRRAWALASRVFGLLTLALILITGVLYLFTPQVVGLLGLGLSPEDLSRAATMTYVILPFMALIGMAAFAGGLLLFLDRTDVYSLAPVSLSVGVVLGVITLKPVIGIYSIAAGFVLGALLQFVVQVPFVIGAGSKLGERPSLSPRKGEDIPEMGAVFSQSGWILLQSFSAKTVEIVDRVLASFLVPGSVAALYFSQRLIQVPFGVVGLAVGRAGVTQLNDYAQEERWPDFKRTVLRGLGFTLGIMIPLAVFTFALADPVTALVFGRGEFGGQSVALTSLALAMYGLGLPAMAAVALYTRVFPALGRNDLPLYTTLAAAGLNVGLNFLLVKTPLRHGGLALASSIAFTANAGAMAILLNRLIARLGGEPVGLKEGLALMARPLVAAIPAGALAWWAASLVPSLGSFAWIDLTAAAGLLAGSVIGGLVFLFIYLMLAGLAPRAEGRRIILTGGGSAGHINPALAIARGLDDGNTEFLYVGARGRVEEVVVPKTGIELRLVRSSGYPGLRPSWALIKFLFNLAAGTLKSLVIIAGFRPVLIVGTGGFGAAPVVFAAQILRKAGLIKTKVVLHEQNAMPGRLNLLVGRWADMVLVTFPQTLKYFPKNGCLVGYPVRTDIGRVSREEGRKRLGFDIPEGRTVVFAFGGSQGSRTINRALVDALGRLMPLKERLFIIHGMGLFDTEDYHAKEDTEERLRARYSPGELEEIKGFYLSRDYFHNIEAVYAVSDFCIIRGGAGSLNEVARAGLASIIIPKAGLSGDHQVMNARAMAAAGLAHVIYEEPVLVDGRQIEAVAGQELAAAITAFVEDPGRVKEMGRKSEETFGGDPVGTIVEAIDRGECPEGGKGSGHAAIRSAELPGNNRLLTVLTRARARAGPGYTPEEVFLDPEDLAYLRKRAAGLLLSDAWQVRNLGVKLAGLLHDFEKIPVLCFMIKEKKPVAWYKRLLGGDFEQVGFIRRNALSAFRVMDRLTEEVEDALVESFGDPYYEVRAEAARTASHFGDRFVRQREVEEGLMGLLDDRHFEVAEAAARALGRVGRGPKVLKRLLGFYDQRLWRLREAALFGIIGLVERGQARGDEEVLREAGMFLLTATDFRPHFSIKKTFLRLMDALKREGGDG